MAATSPKPKLAHDLYVHKKGNFMTIRIDGDDFPFFLDRQAIEVRADPDRAIKSITLHLLFDGAILINEEKDPLVAPHKTAIDDEFEFAPDGAEDWDK